MLNVLYSLFFITLAFIIALLFSKSPSVNWGIGILDDFVTNPLFYILLLVLSIHLKFKTYVKYCAGLVVLVILFSVLTYDSESRNYVLFGLINPLGWLYIVSPALIAFGMGIIFRYFLNTFGKIIGGILITALSFLLFYYLVVPIGF